MIIYGRTETEYESGYANVKNVCVDLCEGLNCGIGGTCLAGNCTCQTGFANVENYCEEICALSSCKELITRVTEVTCIFFCLL